MRRRESEEKGERGKGRVKRIGEDHEGKSSKQSEVDLHSYGPSRKGNPPYRISM